MGKLDPECETCGTQEYEIKDGHYFCTLCHTQSQELGIVKEVDMDGMLNMGFKTKTISISSSGKRKQKRSYAGSGAHVDHWSSVEGYTQVLNRLVTQLEALGVQNIRDSALDIWSRYVQSLGIAFLNEQKEDYNADARSVVSMSYRDKWNFYGGPNAIDSSSFVVSMVNKDAISKQRKRKKTEEEAQRESDEELEGDARDLMRKRSRKRNAFYKSFSESFRADSEDDGPSSSGRSLTNPDSDQDTGSVISSASSMFSTVSGTRSISLLSDLHSLISNSTVKTKYFRKKGIPSILNVENMRAVLVLAVTCIPGSTLNTSDLANLFNSEDMSRYTSLKALPSTYRTTAIERMELTEWRHSLSLLPERDLRSQAFNVASYLRLTKNNRLILSTKESAKLTLERYAADLGLPTAITQHTFRMFEKSSLFDLDCSLASSKTLPSVAARLLGLLMITLKMQFGLDGVQEYHFSHNATLVNNKLEQEPDAFLDNSEGSRESFDILAWIRLSKLRLDHLASGDMFVRAQYHDLLPQVGCPHPTIRAMDQERRILEKIGKGVNKSSGIIDGLRATALEFASEADPEEDQMKTLNFLKERTESLCKQTKNNKLRGHLERLLSMPSHDIRLYYDNPQRSIVLRSFDLENIQLEKNFHLVVYQKFKDLSKMRNCRVQPPRIPDLPCSQKTDSFKVFEKRYWHSPMKVGGHWKGLCDSEFLNFIQILPDNYTWVLRYLASYAMIPLVALEREVCNLEGFILQNQPQFFGLSALPSSKHKRSSSRKKVKKKTTKKVSRSTEEASRSTEEVSRSTGEASRSTEEVSRSTEEVYRSTEEGSRSTEEVSRPAEIHLLT